MYMSGSLHTAYKRAAKEFGDKNIPNGLDGVSKTLAARFERASWFSISDASSWVSPGDQRIAFKLKEPVDTGVLEKDGRTNPRDSASGTRSRV
jgi:hypothetical protein